MVDSKQILIHLIVVFSEIARLHGGGALNVRWGPESEYRLVIRVRNGRFVVLSLLQRVVDLLIVRRLGIVCRLRRLGVSLWVTVVLFPKMVRRLVLLILLGNEIDRGGLAAIANETRLRHMGPLE